MEGGPAKDATGSFPLGLAAFQWRPRRYQNCLGGSSVERGPVEDTLKEALGSFLLLRRMWSQSCPVADLSLSIGWRSPKMSLGPPLPSPPPLGT